MKNLIVLTMLLSANAFASPGPILSIPQALMCSVKSATTSVEVSAVLKTETIFCQPTYSPYQQECFRFSYPQSAIGDDNSPMVSISLPIEVFSGEVNSPASIVMNISKNVDAYLADRSDRIVEFYRDAGHARFSLTEMQLHQGFSATVRVPVVKAGKIDLEPGILQCQ